ncbi:hypothetical protein HY218_02480 [Candidatus Saccharibacteria bacterium]|nr:hypothetical protein [Candidatus Saccharibacteria bacterium]
MSKTYAIDQDKWAKLSIFEQLGNIYSEVGRSFTARRSHNANDYQAAISRAIDLFDMTIDQLVDSKSPKSKEVLRAKEQYLATIYDGHASQATIHGLDNYFLQFAVAARLNR